MDKSTKSKSAVTSGSSAKPGSVEQWVARLSPEQQAIFAEVRDTVAQQAPAAAVLIKWGHPIWDSGGPFILFKPATHHVTLGFWHGTALPDPEGLLEGEGGSVRHIKLRVPGDLRKFPVDQWIQKVLALNAEVGDASKRK
ncbi:DUF1801 domain-containing protein [Paludibaculum fermentans]|uniref:DUF1801 domain-containing protein n=1 Tax=Paludibaculum fermentans TaxID=1473598 RepID=A0A7S7NWM2_PALFE|nr:DUF1801 domain-containing protein [Paludibaculum fermentans]QOY91110.1 DUF1801 domain-containing protein [Paludibaculum fermentans]